MNVTADDLYNLALQATGMTSGQWQSLAREMQSDATMNQIMKRDWNAKSRDTEEAIREYYRSSEAWFINTYNHGYGALLSMAASARPDLAPWCRKLAETMQAPGGKVLDYGGGFFKDTWPLASAGYHVAVAEVKGPVTRFLKSFISAAGLDKKFSVIEVDSETPITDLYDGIVCFETLEHLLRPEALTLHLHQHVKPGGPFAFSVTFGAPEHAPYHVASNAPFGEWRVWAAVLEKVGFTPLWEDPNGTSIKIWRAKV